MILTRREALAVMATVCGGTIFGANNLLAGAANALSGFSFADSDRALLNEIAETIIPATPDSGGAKTAGVVGFMEEIVRDFYSPAERTAYMDGLLQIQATSQERFSGRDFVSLTPENRHAVLLTFEKPNATPDYYLMIKQLTVWGYFSSEVGATQALAHIPVPGRYASCITVDPATTKAWSE
jgi:hypothetical protein